MMKKFAAMLLTGVMAFSLAACGGSTGSSSAAAEPAAEAAPAQEAAPAADAAAADADEAAVADDDSTFVVGFDAEYPPYGYLDEATGDYTGFDLG